ncbi:hypothetical protein, partial [Cronobacter sakazakii]
PARPLSAAGESLDSAEEKA